MNDKLFSQCTYLHVKDKKWRVNLEWRYKVLWEMSFKILTLKDKNKFSPVIKIKIEYKGTSLMYQATEPKKDETRDTVLHTSTVLTHICMQYACLPQDCTYYNRNIARRFLKDLEQNS